MGILYAESELLAAFGVGVGDVDAEVGDGLCECWGCCVVVGACACAVCASWVED